MAPPAHDDVLVLDYLATLWAAAEDLPPETRDDLMNTVAGYIAMRRDLADEPARVLSRLGPPEQLVAAVRRSGTPTHLRLPVAPAPAAVAPASRPGGSERAAIALLLGGSFVLPGVSQAAALLIASMSPRWTPVQKAAAWMLVVGPVAGTLVLLVLLIGAGMLSGGGFVLFYLASCTGAVAAGLTLRATS